MDLVRLKLMLINFWIIFSRESSDSCGYFMSYKVNFIITPFCRNLLAPASALDFFVITDDGLPGSCYKRAKTWFQAIGPMGTLDGSFSTDRQKIVGGANAFAPPTCPSPM